MDTVYAFGPFRLDVSAEILFRGADPLPVGRRAVGVLRALLERPGAPVSKDDLMQAAWPGLLLCTRLAGRWFKPATTLRQAQPCSIKL